MRCFSYRLSQGAELSRVIHGPLDTEPLKALLKDPSAGAYVEFEGWVRDHHAGRRVLDLHYDCHVPMAEKELAKILSEATSRFGLTRAEALHRVGPAKIGDLVVWVGASAGHRQEAFEGCRYVIEKIKADLPIWKNESYVGGERDWQHRA